MRAPLVILPVCLGLAAAMPATAAELRGSPRVIDGETLEVAGTRLRLFGIDAPESGQHCLFRDRLYDCGEISRSALLDLTAGAEVVCRPLTAARDEPLAARCEAGGYDLSEGMTYTGWALAGRAESTAYVGFEDGAREAKRGLWRGHFVAPWDWRAGERLPEERARTE